MVGQLEAALVEAARAGEQRALDELIAQYLPLVYNIAGRALDRRTDVDDVVQDTMLRVVRGLHGLRDPERFRSWLVAVTMNQVREHRRSGYAAPEPLEEFVELADPGADFVDLTLTQLGLSGQRREVAQATSWLDADDRQLLSLWWLEAAGQLTRAELVEALELDPHHAAVRVARMKAQLEAARLVVRALTSGSYCPGLGDVAAGWRGQPTPLWRKRFARPHPRMRFCPTDTAELIPAERLLAGLALTPLPAGYVAYVLGGVHAAGGAAGGVAGASGVGSAGSAGGAARAGGAGSGGGTNGAAAGPGARVPGQRVGGHRRRPRAGHLAHVAVKPAITIVAIAAVAGASLVVVRAISPSTRTTASRGTSQGPGAVAVVGVSRADAVGKRRAHIASVVGGDEREADALRDEGADEVVCEADFEYWHGYRHEPSRHRTADPCATGARAHQPGAGAGGAPGVHGEFGPGHERDQAQPDDGGRLRPVASVLG